jgi:hypothetical protein
MTKCALVNMMLQTHVPSECVLKLASILQVTDMTRRSQGMALGEKGDQDLTEGQNVRMHHQ